MATITVYPGAQITFDPSDKKVIIFDYDALNLAAGVQLTNSGPDYGITIEAIKQLSTTALTFDSAGLVTGDRKVQARFLATTATRGDRYRVHCKATTNETPSQEKEYSIFLSIADR